MTLKVLCLELGEQGESPTRRYCDETVYLGQDFDQDELLAILAWHSIGGRAGEKRDVPLSFLALQNG